MNRSRSLSLMAFAIVFLSLGCTQLASRQMEKALSSSGPGTAPDDPTNLNSGMQNPFSLLNPEREIWVATYGDDADPGTLFEPKRTIAAAVALAQPGTAIMVKGGVYRERLVFPYPGGQSGRPIWLRSADGKGAAEITQLMPDEEPVQLIAVNAVIVEGFKIDGGVLILDDALIRPPTNIVVQNNIITNGLVDGIYAGYGQNIFLIGNDISGSPRGQGIQAMQVRNLFVVDNYIHDLRTHGTKNDGVNLKGDSREILILNNIVERIDGSALVLEGLGVTARANSLHGTRRAVTFSGCSNCSLERNNILANAGVLSDVGLSAGDSPAHPTMNISLTENCVYRPDWLYVESGTGTGLVNQSNSADACH